MQDYDFDGNSAAGRQHDTKEKELEKFQRRIRWIRRQSEKDSTMAEILLQDLPRLERCEALLRGGSSA